MKIYGYENSSISEEKYLYKALGIDLKEKNIISFVGGGGKQPLFISWQES